MIKTPPFLKEGDTIGMISPASSINADLANKGIQLLEQQGFKIKISRHAFESKGYFAGSDNQRREDLQKMLDDPEIKAIFCIRGGYGTIRVLESLDFKKFEQNPKWIVGFSDITILHALCANMSIASIHGPMPIQYGKSEQLYNNMLETISLLKGENITHSWATSQKSSIDMTGEIFGGNLTVLASLIGTPFEPGWGKKILFLEDVGEYVYKIDRILWQLSLSGIFENIKALILGEFTDIKDTVLPFGASVEELFLEHAEKYKIPVINDFPAGHGDINKPIVLGKKIRLKVSDNNATMEYF